MYCFFQRKLYLFEPKKIYEMTTQCEVLDTITTDTGLMVHSKGFANAEGMIYILSSSGKVYCFDPFGEKQLTELQNLNHKINTLVNILT